MSKRTIIQINHSSFDKQKDFRNNKLEVIGNFERTNPLKRLYYQLPHYNNEQSTITYLYIDKFKFIKPSVKEFYINLTVNLDPKNNNSFYSGFKMSSLDGVDEECSQHLEFNFNKNILNSESSRLFSIRYKHELAYADVIDFDDKIDYRYQSFVILVEYKVDKLHFRILRKNNKGGRVEETLYDDEIDNITFDKSLDYELYLFDNVRKYNHQFYNDKITDQFGYFEMAEYDL